MFSRDTPGYQRGSSDRDPLHVRIATAVVVLGLIATGAVVVWHDAISRGSALLSRPAGTGLAENQAQLGPRPLALSPSTISNAGLRLLSQAAAAYRTVSYQGVQLTAWRDQNGGDWLSSKVDVWHQADERTLISPALVAAAPAVPPDDMSRAPIASGSSSEDAGQLDPEGGLDMTQQMVALLSVNYQVTVGGAGTVAGRSARQVMVRRSDGNLAARFWLDSATKLPLRRDMYDTSTRLVSEDAFVSLQLGAAGSTPAPDAGPQAKPLATAQLTRLRTQHWPLPSQLAGNLTLVDATETGTGLGTVVDLAYSDGLSVLSLFLQRGQLPAAMTDWTKVSLQGERVYAVDPDQRSVAWSARGYVYTLIADAPDQTVDQVIVALPHDAKPGFFVRIGRGMRRLASWVNPFR